MLDRQPHQLRKRSSSRERDCAFGLRNHCSVILNVGCTIAGRAKTLAPSRTRRRVTRARRRRRRRESRFEDAKDSDGALGFRADRRIESISL